MLRNFKFCSLIILLALFISSAKSKDLNEIPAHDRLMNHLFVNYDAHAIPVPKGEVIDLHVNLELQHFNFRESDGSFDFVGLLNIFWHDSKLIWNPQKYNNITSLSVDQSVVWVPDLEIYNNIVSNFFEMHRKGVILIENTGRVIWSDNIKCTLFCTPSLKNWPHDQHSCKLRLGSWIYSGIEVDMFPEKANASYSFSDTNLHNTQFQVTNFTVLHILSNYECCSEAYVTLDYFIEFERRAAFATIFNSFAFCIVLLNLLALSLPPGRTEKLWLNACSVLMVVGHLIYFNSKVAKLARETPYIVAFHCACLVMITGSILSNVFSLFILRTCFLRKHCPNFIKKLLKNRIVGFIMMNRNKRGIQEDESGTSKFVDVKLFDDDKNLLSSNSYFGEWVLLVHFLERLLLICYCFTYFILASVCLP